MSRVSVFQPERRSGMFFQVGAILVLILMSAWGVWQASRAEIGPVFLSALLPLLISAVLAPMLAYRAYALRSATYTLERDGMHLRWGLRIEDIPSSAILWIRKSEEQAPPLPLPWLRWPGGVLGVRYLAGGGTLEYLASSSSGLILIGTPGKIFAISPAERDEFLQAHRRLAELGSVSPLPARSIYPSFVLARVWQSRPARVLLLGGLIFNLLMLIWVSLIAPGRTQVTLGFIAGAEAVPAVRLLLLPIISTFFYVVDFFMGLFFYRREEPASPGSQTTAPQGATPGQTLAYVLWGSGTLTSALFLSAIFIILQNR